MITDVGRFLAIPWLSSIPRLPPVITRVQSNFSLIAISEYISKSKAYFTPGKSTFDQHHESWASCSPLQHGALNLGCTPPMLLCTTNTDDTSAIHTSATRKSPKGRSLNGETLQDCLLSFRTEGIMYHDVVRCCTLMVYTVYSGSGIDVPRLHVPPSSSSSTSTRRNLWSINAKSAIQPQYTTQIWTPTCMTSLTTRALRQVSLATNTMSTC